MPLTAYICALLAMKSDELSRADSVEMATWFGLPLDRVREYLDDRRANA